MHRPSRARPQRFRLGGLTLTGVPRLLLLMTPLILFACSDAPEDADAQDFPDAAAPGGEIGGEATQVIETARAHDLALARELEAIHEATKSYQDVEVALEAGYVRDPMDMCITPEVEGLPRQLGGMGIHYFRPDLLGLTATEPRVAGTGVHTDFREPSVLIYEPQADGSLDLVAVENLIFAAPWRAAGDDGPPEFMGHEYYHLVNNPETSIDEAHGFEPHYELHIWLYRENPSGMSQPFNPRVSCEHHDSGHTDHETP